MSEQHMTIRLRHDQEHTPPVLHTPMPNPTPKKKRPWFFLAMLGTGVVLLSVAVLIGFTVLTSASKNAKDGDPKEMVGRVSKLMVLPDEAPTVAVVSDLEKLKGQQFFARAHEGDIVLMYPKAQKAILYNPTLNKIIEVAPITNDTTQP